MGYQCLHCSRTFSTPFGLKRHISDRHQYISIDAEDSSGITLDDAINDKMHPQNTEWPNDIYREFMEIVMEYQLSNSCDDRIIKLIDKSRRAPDENRLPKVPRKVINFLMLTNFLI